RRTCHRRRGRRGGDGTCGLRDRCNGPLCSLLYLVLDATTLRRTAAVVRLGRHVGDRADLEAGGLEGTDGGLAARTRALDEDVDLLHAVLLRLAGGVLGGHLRGERGGLTGALEPDVAGGGPGNDGTLRVRDGHDGVVEGGLDVRVALGHVLLCHAAASAAAGGGLLSCHVLLLLPGDRLLRTLAGASVGLGALATDGQATTVAQALVGADLDLASDVGLDLAAEVAFDLPRGLDGVTQGRNLFVRQVVGAQVRGDAGLVQQLGGTGGADAVDVGESDLHALVARQVNSSKACHSAVSFRLVRWFSPLPSPPGSAPWPGRMPGWRDVLRGAPATVAGGELTGWGKARPCFPTARGPGRWTSRRVCGAMRVSVTATAGAARGRPSR